MRLAFKTILVLILAASCVHGKIARPNILMIVIDDMGYGDISAHGHPWLETPNLDKLWKQSARMTDFMVSPTCAPTRAALMTGAHEFRSGVTHTTHGMNLMNRECVTLPQVLKQAGYVTGLFGKWHLGNENGHEPWKRGFDVAVVAENEGTTQAHRKPVDPVFFFNGERRPMKGVRDMLFAEEAMDFMAEGRDEPFFCYFATYDPHRTHWAPERFMKEMRHQVDAAKAKGILGVDDRRVDFFAEVLLVDSIVGELMDFLDEKDLASRTLVYLVTDNGGTDGVDACNAGMRGHKTTAWMGGTRAMSFWRWPGVIRPRDVDAACAHIDILPTLAEVAGSKPDAMTMAQVEGRSTWGLLTEKDLSWPERNLFAHVARWEPGKRDAHKYLGAMVRRGRFDLVRDEKGSMGRAYTDRPEYHRARSPGGDWALYDRQSDPAQQHNLAARHPSLVKELVDAFEQWWKTSERHLIHEKTAAESKQAPAR